LIKFKKNSGTDLEILVEIPLLFAVPWGIRLSKKIPRGFLRLAFALVMLLVGALTLLQVLDVL